MIFSMTGYGVATKSFKSPRGLLELTVEVKTVNSKFLDISIRSPKAYIPLDSEIQKWIRQTLKRGRVDVNLNLRVLEGDDHELHVNLHQVQALQTLLKKVSEQLSLKEGPTLSDLLRLPDWIESRDAKVDLGSEVKNVREVVELALEQVVKARTLEGKALHEVIDNHRDRFGEILESVGRQHEGLLKSLRDRARERLKSLFDNEGIDPHRLEQELVLWVARSDFQEELDRILHHLTTFDTLIEGKAEVGRKLEFLVQELHREVNTLGSKCPDPKVTPLVIEMKSSIERIREQIQNIE